MSGFQSLIQEIKSRNIGKRLAIYLSSALTGVGVLKLIMEVFTLPPFVLPVVVTLICFGFINAVVYAWFHSKGEKVPFSRSEKVIHVLTLVVGISVAVFYRPHAGAGVHIADPKSIAVLPFENLSDSKEDEYFSDGITDDIITQLTKVRELKVISRTSVMKYKSAAKTAREISKELGVANILEGSVQRAGSRVRIVGQLIDAENDRHLWAETYDRDMKDIFAIQSEVAQNIARALQAKLSPNEITQIERKSTDNLDAYALYLQGREYYYRYTKDDNERAIELFKKAVALDPNYGLAYAGLGDAYDRRQFHGFPANWTDTAVFVSEKAVALDPSSAEGYKALGNALQSRGEFRRALDMYGKAVEINPNYAPVFAGISAVNLKLGQLDETVRWTRKAVAAQPDFARWSAQLGWFYSLLGFDSLGTYWSRKAIELQPDFYFPRVVLARIGIYDGRFAEARDSINNAIGLSTDKLYALDAASDLEMFTGNFRKAEEFQEKILMQTGMLSATGFKMAFLIHKLGEEKRFKSLLDTLLVLADTSKFVEGDDVPYFIAGIYATIGNTNKSVHWLRKAIDLGCREYRRLRIDPMFDRVRNNEEFKIVVADLDRRIDEMRRRVELASSE